MRHAAALLFSLLVPVLTSARANAQDNAAGSATAQAAAIKEIVSLLQTAERLPGGLIGLDSRVLEARAAAESGAGAVTYAFGTDTQQAHLFTLAGAERVDFDGAVVCENDSPRSCRLPGVVAMFAAGQPEQIGSGARVIIAARWRSALAKTPVAYARFAVSLERSPSCEWIVRDVRTLFID